MVPAPISHPVQSYLHSVTNVNGLLELRPHITSTAPSPPAIRNGLIGSSICRRDKPDLPPTYKPKFAIIGAGFVGESLLQQFGAKFETIGYDISRDRIQQLSLVFTRVPNVTLTSNEADLSQATHFLISVPTSLRPDKSVDLRCVRNAVRTVLRHARAGSTIVIESSVSVGTTRQILGPYRHTFHCGMSPERVDPGRDFPEVQKIPKIVSGLTPHALKEITKTYGQVFSDLVPVSTPEVAEMTKLHENCYRMVNIAYANEISDACRKHGIDPREMIEAAATKPYGFQPFYPGLGVGGHCIPVNPFYLLTNNKDLPILERATKLMWNRPKKLAKKFHRRCLNPVGGGGGAANTTSPTANTSGLTPARAGGSFMPRVLIVGVGFKPGQSVTSCSPSLSFAQQLLLLGCEKLAFYDPLVPQSAVPIMDKLEDAHWSSGYIDENFDGVAVCTQQQGVEFGVLGELRRTFVRSFV